MNDFELLSYLLTWLLAFIFFLLWRSNRDRADGLEDDLERMTKAMEYYKQRFEVTEQLRKAFWKKSVKSVMAWLSVTELERLDMTRL